MVLQELRDFQRILAVALHAQGQGLQALQDETSRALRGVFGKHRKLVLK